MLVKPAAHRSDGDGGRLFLREPEHTRGDAAESDAGKPRLGRRVQARAIALGQLTAVRIGGTSVGDGPHRVDNVARGQVVAVGQSGLDLLVLGGLVVVAVEVLIGNTQGVELRVERGTDAGDVGISERVVEHANLQVGSLGRLSSRGLFSGGVFFGRGGLRSRRGLRSRGFGGLLGACRQSKYHGQRKKQSNDLFHLGKILHS